MKLSDREMLGIAARAINLNGWYIEGDDWYSAGICYTDEDDCNHVWNPLEDDGLALCLANQNEISIIFGTCMDDAPIVTAKYFGGEITNCNFPDPYKATRRAVVEAVVAQQLQLEECLNV